MRHLKFALKTLLSIALSAVFVWLSLRHTDLRAVGASIAAADPLRVLAYVGLMLVVHLVRTVRWGILLEPLGHVGFKRLNSASAVGFMLLMLLPLRLGEFARPLLIARPPEGRGPTLRRSGAMASVVVERIVDGIFIGLLGVISLRTLGDSATGRYVGFARKASVLVALGFFGLCVALVLAFFLRERAVSLVRAALTPFSPRLAARASSMVEGFISALHLGSGWKVLAFFLLTALYWTLNAAGLGVLAPAFGFTALAPLMLATILTTQVVGVMVPAGPGMVGTMQLATQIGLSLFVADGFSAHGAGYANTIWMLQFGIQVALGTVFLLIGHVSLKGVLGDAPSDDGATASAVP